MNLRHENDEEVITSIAPYSCFLNFFLESSDLNGSILPVVKSAQFSVSA